MTKTAYNTTWQFTKLPKLRIGETETVNGEPNGTGPIKHQNEALDSAVSNISDEPRAATGVDRG